MINGEVQAENEPKDTPVRKSLIRKSIRRTLNTAPYETLVIEDHIEEEIEWTTLEERQKKVKNWETVLLQQFQEWHDRACQDLNLQHKVAFLDTSQNKVKRKFGPDTGEVGELDTLLEDLDSLDAVPSDDDLIGA